MKKWFCALAVSLMACAPALADIPAGPWPDGGSSSGPFSWVLILIVAAVVVVASIVLWRVIRKRKGK